MTDIDKQTRRQWSEEELIVLAAIYNSSNFSVGDDAQDECRTIADCFGRTPSAIDRQWRNMDAVVKSKIGFNIGKLVATTALQYIYNPAAHKKIAIAICQANEWPLEDLIVDGHQRKENKPTIQMLEPGVRTALKAFCDGVEFKVFSSGSQGFERIDTAEFDGARYRVTVNAVVSESKSNKEVHVSTSPQAMAKALRDFVDGVRPTTLATGRIGYYGKGHVSLDGHIFQVSVRAVQTGGVK